MKKQLMKIAVLAISAILFVTTGCNQQSHEHTYSADWSSDDTYHWHAAACEHTEEVSEKGKHKWNSGEITTEATCSAEGVKTYTCTVCGKTKTTPVDKLSHSWDDGEEVTAPTCGAAGKKKYKCKVCSTEKEESVPKLAHTYSSEWSKDATDHWHAATCEHTTEKSGKAAHTWDDGEITATPTCYATGTKKFTCTVCGQIKTEVLPTIDHSYVVETLQAATILEKGRERLTCTRTGCDSTKSATHEIYEDIPELYSTPVDCTTGEAATPASRYVYFGVFPKTIIDADVTVEETESSSKTMGANKYYKGSDQEWYVKCLENARYSTGDQYKYSNGEQAKQSNENSYKWFKVEPIKWKVLTTDYNETGKALLLAEDMLTSGIPYYEGYRQISGKTIYSTNYKYSTMRAYLNGKFEEDDTQSKTAYTDKGFLQTAFSETAQSLIADTIVINDGESTWDGTNGTAKADGTFIKPGSTEPCPDYTCENTTDKIFLLSLKELSTSSYGLWLNNRIRFPTDYAKANYAEQNSNSNYGGIWWLRSPYHLEPRTLSVNYNGTDWNGSTDIAYWGVVPALTISLPAE